MQLAGMQNNTYSSRQQGTKQINVAEILRGHPKQMSDTAGAVLCQDISIRITFSMNLLHLSLDSGYCYTCYIQPAFRFGKGEEHPVNRGEFLKSQNFLSYLS